MVARPDAGQLFQKDAQAVPSARGPLEEMMMPRRISVVGLITAATSKHGLNHGPVVGSVGTLHRPSAYPSAANVFQNGRSSQLPELAYFPIGKGQG